jgi:site-specific DNA recombinase
MKVAIYARYSSDNQRAASIEDQSRNCRRRAEAEGWEVVTTFTDAAMSGSDSSRPGYRSTLAAAGRKEFDILLVDDLSRLSRDSIEAERTIRKLEFQGVRIIAVSDGYDSTSKARKIQRGFKNLMNETFLDDLRERVHRGHEGQARKGFWNGGRPYGYKLKPITDPKQRDAYDNPLQIGTKLQIDAKQAAVIREIFDKYIAGKSHRAIAADLNARGVASAGTTWARKKHRSRGWVQSAIRVIVMNRLYCGEVRWNQTKFVRDPNTERIVRRNRPKSEWVVRQDESLRIISDAVFGKAQARSKIRSSADGRLKCGGKLRYLLSGLLRCHACGASYVFADAEKYACSSYVNGGAGACSNKARVRRDVLEREVVGPIKDDLLSPARVARIGLAPLSNAAA